MLIGELTIASVVSHARRAHPAEACGLLQGGWLVGDIHVADALPAPNCSPTPERAYRICDDWLLEQLQRPAEPGAPQPVGAYHAHPDGNLAFSRRDRAQAWPAWLYLVVAATTVSPGWSAWWADAAGGVREVPVQVARGATTRRAERS